MATTEERLSALEQAQQSFATKTDMEQMINALGHALSRELSTKMDALEQRLSQQLADGLKVLDDKLDMIIWWQNDQPRGINF